MTPDTLRAGEQVVVELSLPDKCLSPNARCHWRVKGKATKAYRAAAKWQTVLATSASYDDHGPRGWTAATVLATFYFKDKRRRDRDNLLASLKSAFDGLADSGLVTDDAAFSYMPVLTEVDKARPRVVLTITRTEL
jgi:crossover junction endodeoxyribonuclease RusA